MKCEFLQTICTDNSTHTTEHIITCSPLDPLGPCIPRGPGLP